MQIGHFLVNKVVVESLSNVFYNLVIYTIFCKATLIFCFVGLAALMTNIIKKMGHLYFLFLFCC